MVRCRAVVCCQARDVDGTVRAHEKRYVPSFRVLFFHLISRQVESIDESSQSRLGPADRPDQPCWERYGRYRRYDVQYLALIVFQGAVVPSTLDCSVCSNTPTDLFRSCKETGTLYFPCLTPAPLVTLLKAHDHGTDRTQQQQQQHNRVWLEGSAGIRFISFRALQLTGALFAARAGHCSSVLRVSDPSPQFIYLRSNCSNCEKRRAQQ